MKKIHKIVLLIIVILIIIVIFRPLSIGDLFITEGKNNIKITNYYEYFDENGGLNDYIKVYDFKNENYIEELGQIFRKYYCYIDVKENIINIFDNSRKLEELDEEFKFSILVGKSDLSSMSVSSSGKLTVDGVNYFMTKNKAEELIYEIKNFLKIDPNITKSLDIR